ncbi:hypothetical protein FBU30_009862 [Linnemannia zychae]|nr:hypothetical protein FBU30_009862 [Linnemannia zychae]
MATKATDAILKEFAASTSEEHVKNSTVLDFGCGTGLASFKIAEKVNHVVGVDASEGMLTYLHKKLDTLPELAHLKAANKVHTICHLITDDAPLPEPELSKYLDGEEGGFDMVYSNYVLHHIEDVQGVVNTMANRLLKKGGWVILVDFEGHHVHGGVENSQYHHGHATKQGHQCAHSDARTNDQAHGQHHHGHSHGHEHHHEHSGKDGAKQGHQCPHTASHTKNQPHHNHHHQTPVKTEDFYKDENGKPLE